MSKLIMVRHGQASFLQDDYDKLSELGIAQSEALGKYWAARALTFDKVYIGPLLRHKETMEGVKRMYEKYELPWPEVEMLPELAEHHAPEVTQALLPTLAKEDEQIKEWSRIFLGDLKRKTKFYLHIYRRISEMWVEGKLEGRYSEEIQPWKTFRAMVQKGMEKMTQAEGKSKTIVAFTSGGTVGASLGNLHGLGNTETLALTWIVQNATLTEYLFSKGETSLMRFNALPHLQEEGMVSFV